jgi:hypothetical protein
VTIHTQEINVNEFDFSDPPPRRKKRKPSVLVALASSMVKAFLIVGLIVGFFVWREESRTAEIRWQREVERSKHLHEQDMKRYR